MKRETFILKLAVILIAIPVLAICVILLPLIVKDAAESSTKMAYVLLSIFAVVCVSVIPFFIALYQAFKLLSYIDMNKAFSELSVKALKNIKNCAGSISILYLLSIPLFYIVGEIDDAPGVILIGMMLIFAPMVIAVFAAVLQKLLKNAIDLKDDNDLTI